MSENYDQHIADIYTHQFESYTVKMPFGSYGRPLLYQNIYIPAEKKSYILDAGCGNGNYASNLVNMGYQHVYGIDLFKNHQVDGFTYNQASLNALPFDDNFFDFVYSFSVIYYLSDTESGVKELCRVMKPGANLILTAHTRFSVPTLIRVIKRLLGFSKHLTQVHFHSTSYYIDHLKKNGFEIIKADGYLLSPFLYKLYLYFRKVILILFGIKLSDMNKITKNTVFARIKSEIAYHSIIIARKKNAAVS
jgi:SAM-dependent methyltransferase